MYNVGILFDIEQLGSGLYGYTAYQIFFDAVDTRRLGVCSLSDGDTTATLAGHANQFCIAVESLDASTISTVKAAMSGSNAKGLLPLGSRFMEGTIVNREPLVTAAQINTVGELVGCRTGWVTEAWQKSREKHRSPGSTDIPRENVIREARQTAARSSSESFLFPQRIGRVSFLARYLCSIFVALLAFFTTTGVSQSEMTPFIVVEILVLLALLYYTIRFVFIARVRDTGLNRAFTLLLFVPLVGTVFLVALFFIPTNMFKKTEVDSALSAAIIIFNREFSPKETFVNSILTKMIAHGRPYRDWMKENTPMRIFVNPRAQDPVAFAAVGAAQFRRLIGDRFDLNRMEHATFEGSDGISGVILTHWEKCKVEFAADGKVLSVEVPQGRWALEQKGQNRYYTQTAHSLLQATESLRRIDTIPALTYYMVDTPDGSLGRDTFGFYTEAPIKTENLILETKCTKSEAVEFSHLRGFGDELKNLTTVALLQKNGEYSRLVLLMKCGRCAYESPVETQPGSLLRECYRCGVENKGERGNISVATDRGVVQI